MWSNWWCHLPSLLMSVSRTDVLFPHCPCQSASLYPCQQLPGPSCTLCGMVRASQPAGPYIRYVSGTCKAPSSTTMKTDWSTIKDSPLPPVCCWLMEKDHNTQHDQPASNTRPTMQFLPRKLKLLPTILHAEFACVARLPRSLTSCVSSRQYHIRLITTEETELLNISKAFM